MAIGRFEYQAPISLKESLSLLDGRKGPHAILAGGTDLIVQMKHGLTCPDLIVDVKRIPELNRLEWSEGNGLNIGAAVPLGKLVTYAPLKDRFGMLTEACSMIGSTQIRNRATLGGNVCTAAPSADCPPALLCLDAKAAVASLQGTRMIPLEDFFLGPGETAMEKGEVLMEIQIPAPPAFSAGCYFRHTSRAEMDIAVAGVASFLVLEPEGKILQDARIALAAVAPTPIRAPQAEAVLIGKAPTQELIREAAERAGAAANAITDIRASIEYRVALVKVLTMRTLGRACKSLGVSI